MPVEIETFGILVLKGVVLPVVGLLVTWASLKLPMWIKAKVNNESIEGVLTRLSSLAFTVVQEVQQTFVSALADPTSEHLKEARDKAIATLKSHLGPKGLVEIRNVLKLADDEAVDRLIISFIESAVLMLKQQKGPS